MPSGSGNGATVAATGSCSSCEAWSASACATGRLSCGIWKIVPSSTCWDRRVEEVLLRAAALVGRLRVELVELEVRPGPCCGTGSSVSVASGQLAATPSRSRQRVQRRRASARSGERRSAHDERAKSREAGRSSSSSSLRVNSAIAAFNPALQAAADVDDVPEAGHGQQLRREGAVGRRCRRTRARSGSGRGAAPAAGARWCRTERSARRRCVLPDRDTLRRPDVEDDDLVASRGSSRSPRSARPRRTRRASWRRRRSSRQASERQSAEQRRAVISRLITNSSSNSARTSPTSVPAMIADRPVAKLRIGAACGESMPRSSSVRRIAGLRPRSIEPSWIFSAIPIATSSGDAQPLRSTRAASDGAIAIA